MAERREDLTEVITRFNTTTRAIGNRRLELQESLERFPDFMRLANTTFVNLRGTLDEVDPLVEASKPAARKLPGFFDELRPLARDARPTLRDLRQTVRRPGVDNDLVELGRTLPPLATAALDPEQRNGERRLGSLPEASKAFRNATPIQAKFKQYVVDFVGWQDDFSHGGNFDGIGAFASSQVYFNLFDFLGNDQLPDVIAQIRALNERISELESVLDVDPGADDPRARGARGRLAARGQRPRGGPRAPRQAARPTCSPRSRTALGSFNRTTRRNQVRRCPGGAEEPAPDGSNVLSEEDQRLHQLRRGRPRRWESSDPMRRLIAIATVVGAVGLAFVLTGQAKPDTAGQTYYIVLDNAFGLTEGGDLRVGGVAAGQTTRFSVTDEFPARAVVEAQIQDPGFVALNKDATCAVRQQSLIGEYYIDCQPGSPKAGRIPNAGTIPVEQTQSTIAMDLVQNIMRRPYRERFRLILSELGTGLAGRPEDLEGGAPACPSRLPRDLEDPAGAR
ncbi:MAG: MlaD family protein [Thermoleophilaceae bacterium]